MYHSCFPHFIRRLFFCLAEQIGEGKSVASRWRAEGDAEDFVVVFVGEVEEGDPDFSCRNIEAVDLGSPLVRLIPSKFYTPALFPACKIPPSCKTEGTGYNAHID